MKESATEWATWARRLGRDVPTDYLGLFNALNEALAIVEQLRVAGQLTPDKAGLPDLIRRMLQNGGRGPS